MLCFSVLCKLDFFETLLTKKYFYHKYIISNSSNGLGKCVHFYRAMIKDV